jgi:hypothetical protein
MLDSERTCVQIVCRVMYQNPKGRTGVPLNAKIAPKLRRQIGTVPCHLYFGVFSCFGASPSDMSHCIETDHQILGETAGLPVIRPQCLFPRTPGSLHDCWWEGLFSPVIGFRSGRCASAPPAGCNFRVARLTGLQRPGDIRTASKVCQSDRQANH